MKKKRAIDKPVREEPAESGFVEGMIDKAVSALLAMPESKVHETAALVDGINGLPPTSATRVLTTLARMVGEKALPLLEQLAQAQKPDVALASIQALAGVRSERSVAILARLVETSANPQLRKEAKRSLFRLQSQGLSPQVPLIELAAIKERYPVLRSLLSSFDGRGTRAVVFGIERPFDSVERVFLMINDVKGLTDCSRMGMSRVDFVDEADRLVNKSLRGGIWAGAPASYCRQLINEALALNLRSGSPVPRGYLYVKDEIGQPTENYDRPIIYRDLTALEVKWDPTLLEHSGELLDRNEFANWAFDLDEVGPYFIEMQQPRRSAITLPGASQKDRDEDVARRFFQSVVTPERQAAYKRELEETAYLFLRHDRRLDAKLALAVAVAMDQQRGGELVRVPFFRNLLARSFALFEQRLRRGSRARPGESGHVTA